MLMVNMINIRFSNYKGDAILYNSEKNERNAGAGALAEETAEEATMNREGKQFMACGACGIVIDENGGIVSSFDEMAAGFKRIAKLFKRNESSHKAAPAVHA